MIICLLGDIHIGAKLDSPFYADHLERFFNETLFPYVVEKNIKMIVMLGDVFDRRKVTSTETLFRAKRRIFDKLKDMGIDIHIIVGNHDVPFKNTILPSSPRLLLAEYDNINVIDKPTTIGKFDFIPWMCPDNEAECLEIIQNSTSKICFGHFQLVGFEMDPGVVCKEGHDRHILEKYDVVFSGHFHKKSTDGRIIYVGTPCQITMADLGDIRGFHTFDTATEDLNFVANPHELFASVEYDDRTPEAVKAMKKVDFERFKGAYVKVHVLGKTKPAQFAKFRDNIDAVGPADAKIIEDAIVVETKEGEVTTNVEDTVGLIGEVVDELTLDVDPQPLKTLLCSLHAEVLTTL